MTRILTSAEARDRLAVGYALDFPWGETMGIRGGDSKGKPLRLIAEILEREHDVADVLALLEEHPDLKSPELMARVQAVRARLLTAGSDANT